MGAISLPALAIKPQEQPDLLSRVGQLQGIQGQQLQNQMLQQQMHDQQATTAAMRQWDGKDVSDLPGLILKHGGSAQAVFGMKKEIVSYQRELGEMTKTQLANEATKNDVIAGHIDQVKSLPPEQQPQGFEAAKQDLVKRGYLQPEAAQTLQYQGPEQLESLEKFYQSHTQQTQQKLQESETKKNAVETLLKTNQVDVINAWKSNPQQVLAQVDSVVSPQGRNADLNARTKARVQFALSAGDVESAKGAIKEAAEQIGTLEREKQLQTDPDIQRAKLAQATAQKAAEQAIADGDPRAAAQLLVQGVVSPSQIVSSRRPSFAQQAYTEAQRLDPTWNATKAEADFNVAKSSSNVGFFGSAKSLTEKGGTLDQLADVAKDIPANQIPVFNSVADAIKASTGSGPIAKYASIALGVADDYSKVMGGGQGSDTSREQALKLLSAKQSPAQRAASIEGIRGAVSSQIDSRIGNNPVLRKMYGDAQQPRQAAPSQPSGATGKVLSMSAIQQAAKDHGVSVDEAKRQALAQGYTIR